VKETDDPVTAGADYYGIQTLYILYSGWVRTIYIAGMGRVHGTLRPASRFSTN